MLRARLRQSSSASQIISYCHLSTNFKNYSSWKPVLYLFAIKKFGKRPVFLIPQSTVLHTIESRLYLPLILPLPPYLPKLQKQTSHCILSFMPQPSNYPHLRQIAPPALVIHKYIGRYFGVRLQRNKYNGLIRQPNLTSIRLLYIMKNNDD